MENLEQELNKELHRLQIKTKSGFDIVRVEWRPTQQSLRPNNDLVQNGKANGECCNDGGNMTRYIIKVYVRETAKEAFHVIHHEFYEHLIMKPAHHFVELSNVLLKLVNKFQYECQEDIVESIAKMEDEEYEQLCKRNNKS